MKRSKFRVLGLVVRLSLVVSSIPTIALAQAKDTEATEDAPPAEPEDVKPVAPSENQPAVPAATELAADAKASPPANAESASAALTPPSVETAPGAARCRPSLHAGDHPEYRDHSCLENRLEWNGGFLYGGVEIDVGYAKYTFPESDVYPSATVYDFRGRFVVGPMFTHHFGSSGYFVRATGTVVGWVREQANDYQINVDDVYGQVGHEGTWDFQLGRFMTWRVYHKGLGYDLYTLEDTGAAIDPNLANGAYFPHTYEVDYIYLRNSPYIENELAGRAAIHLYPTRYLGFELAGAYGAAGGGSTNTLGGRFAGDFHWKYVRASLGAEFRVQRPIQPTFAAPGTPQQTECPDCSLSYRNGIGGGIILKYSPVELGGGFAKGFDRTHEAQSSPDGGSLLDPASTSERMSYGAYLEVDPGTLVFKRSLILGIGINKTELILENHDQFYHQQGAAYIAFPLGFNDAMIKFVISQAKGEYYDALDVDGNEYTKFDRKMTAGRFRFSQNF